MEERARIEFWVIDESAISTVNLLEASKVDSKRIPAERQRGLESFASGDSLV